MIKQIVYVTSHGCPIIDPFDVIRDYLCIIRKLGPNLKKLNGTLFICIEVAIFIA